MGGLGGTGGVKGSGVGGGGGVGGLGLGGHGGGVGIPYSQFLPSHFVIIIEFLIT